MGFFYLEALFGELIEFLKGLVLEEIFHFKCQVCRVSCNRSLSVKSAFCLPLFIVVFFWQFFTFDHIGKRPYIARKLPQFLSDQEEEARGGGLLANGLVHNNCLRNKSKETIKVYEYYKSGLVGQAKQNKKKKREIIGQGCLNSHRSLLLTLDVK